jgi:hypothetical protein
VWGCNKVVDAGSIVDGVSINGVSIVDGGSIDGRSIDGGSIDGGSIDGRSIDGGSIKSLLLLLPLFPSSGRCHQLDWLVWWCCKRVSDRDGGVVLNAIGTAATVDRSGLMFELLFVLTAVPYTDLASKHIF